MTEKKGLVLVYTGSGKGKTTAALGLALRASGHGAKIFMVQFRKNNPKYGEIQAIRKFLPDFTVVQSGQGGPLVRGQLTQQDVNEAWNAFLQGREAALSGRYDLVIFDEINIALDYGLLPVGEVLRMLAERPAEVDVVLTGRNAPQEIIDAADLVSEVREIKHHYCNGIEARKGIEF
ncbi:MAG: Cob(I)yrinic acid a,c-diamide adenosyltransferase [Syntrophomonadaceae bacterium]|nr:Cob(I)yrinic acid a,c-diamide adenosyltransferase [Bacillota bacterium]